MTLTEIAAAVAACDTAMLVENLDPIIRDQVLRRFEKSITAFATRAPAPPREAVQIEGELVRRMP